jgi:hypothetical protein
VFEFFLDSISREGLVLGRNGDHNTPVGTMFTAVRRSRVHRSPGEFRTEDLGEVGAVALTLHAVHWSGQVIDYIPGWHTAGLAVAGEGLGVLAGLLRELPPHDYLALAAPGSQYAEPNAAADGGGM